MSPTLSNQLDRSWAERLVPKINRLLADFEMLRFNARSARWNGWGEQYPAMTDVLPTFVQHAETATEAWASASVVWNLALCPPWPSARLSTLSATDGVLHYQACTRMLRESSPTSSKRNGCW